MGLWVCVCVCAGAREGSVDVWAFGRVDMWAIGPLRALRHRVATRSDPGLQICWPSASLLPPSDSRQVLCTCTS